MIIIDFSQIMIASVHAGQKDFGSDLNENIIRNIFLTQIKSFKSRFSKYSDEIVLACDGPNNWRKKVFPYYKFKRAENRADSPIDWEMVFNCLDSIYSEIDEYFPYKIIKCDGAEGDDVIAVLCNYFLNNELMQDGLFESRKEILIISSDKDFIQLQEYGNISQWSPLTKKFIKSNEPKHERYLKIIKGDSGDGVMNIFSRDDCFVVGTRQTPATKKKIEPILESLENNGSLPNNLSDELKRNYERNKKMIDLVDYELPKEIEENIIESYKNAKVNNRLYDYFVKYQLRNLFSEMNKF